MQKASAGSDGCEIDASAVRQETLGQDPFVAVRSRRNGAEWPTGHQIDHPCGALFLGHIDAD